MFQVLNTEASKQSGKIGKKRNIQIHSKRVAKELARNYAKKRKVVGLGLLIDERTGTTTFHESLSSRKVIDHGNATSSSETHIEEWSFRYAKSQKVNMQPKSKLQPQNRRKIQFAKDGIGPTDLPFKPTSDLRWKDKPAVTGAHLERTRQEMIAKQKKNVGITASQVVAPSSQTTVVSQISVGTSQALSIVASQVSRASSYVSGYNSALPDDGYAALK
ncbi:hypothetical protein J5N97_003256 [Dioscorea zingiberensis]|uniref:Uncharacterized protein n=1 Tax=Dioscorea zingiberensis TaxID=325984 RepID=A0A9D5HPX2_9LILI|nr:hypothetical protein J5N97_003256 [Dioscorea zingiberensis]